MTVLILVSVLFGAAGVWAADEVQEHRVREMLLAEVEGQLQIAGLQLEIVRENMAEVEDLYEQGLTTSEALQASRVQLREAESQYSLLVLDQEEIRITGREPRNAPSAPLVEGRDFVFQRLAIQAAVAREQVALIEGRLNRARELQQMGAADSESVAQAALALAEARHGLEMLSIRLSLRDRYLEGALSREEMELELDKTQAMKDLELHTRVFENALANLRRLEDRQQMGMISESAVRQARLALVQAEVEVELARRRLEIIMSAVPPPLSPPGGR
jgi:hypothetical protein